MWAPYAVDFSAIHSNLLSIWSILHINRIDWTGEMSAKQTQHCYKQKKAIIHKAIINMHAKSDM